MTAAAGKTAPEASLKVKCPQCARPTVYQGNPWRPFCSERCQLIDLGQWAEGKYALPGEDAAPSEDGEG